MTRTTRNIGKVGVVTAAVAAGLLATSGTASAAISVVVAAPTPAVESISVLVTATPAVLPSIGFTGDVECTVTATPVGEDEDPAGTADVTLAGIGLGLGTATIEDLDAGAYLVTATCTDEDNTVSTLLPVLSSALPAGELPPITPPTGGGSSPLDLLDLFES